MLDDTSEVIDLVLGCGRFSHVFVEDGFVFVANEINSLTGFCAVSVRSTMGRSRIDYELLLAVANDLTMPLQSLKRSLAARRFVGLPKTVRLDHSRDMLACDGHLSDWLVAEMVSDMCRYTLDHQSALNLIYGGGDKFIGNLKQVFGDKFRELLEEPLTKLGSR